MVQALTPETDQANRTQHFLEQSYALFSDTIYESIEPGVPIDTATFNFDLNDPDAPHSPVSIRWNNRFQEFEPLLLARGILTQKDILLTFGQFIDRAKEMILGEENGNSA